MSSDELEWPRTPVTATWVSISEQYEMTSQSQPFQIHTILRIVKANVDPAIYAKILNEVYGLSPR